MKQLSSLSNEFQIQKGRLIRFLRQYGVIVVIILVLSLFGYWLIYYVPFVFYPWRSGTVEGRFNWASTQVRSDPLQKCSELNNYYSATWIGELPQVDARIEEPFNVQWRILNCGIPWEDNEMEFEHESGLMRCSMPQSIPAVDTNQLLIISAQCVITEKDSQIDPGRGLLVFRTFYSFSQPTGYDVLMMHVQALLIE